MKKTIFVAIQYMELGGVERSLLGLLDAIDYSKYEVDLFIYRHSGELMQYINPSVNLMPQVDAYTTLTRPILEIVKEGYFSIAAARVLAKLKTRSVRRDATDISIFQCVADLTTPLLPNISDKVYDLAISFITPHNIVRDRVKARRRAAWIHTDYSTVKLNAKAEIRAWGAYDYIVAISEEVKHGFLSLFPSLEPKIVQLENILSSQFVKSQAQQECSVKMEGDVKLLTVGRFCHAKAFDNAVRICAELVKMGVGVKWYAIGYGDRATIERAIKECSMQDHFIILGKRTNPYPYMKQCDIYVQPSRYEGKAVTVREAQMLLKPAVITAYATSASQLCDGVDGVIVPMDIQGAAQGIKRLIDDTQLQQSLIANCRKGDFGNESVIEHIYKMMDAN